MVGELEEKPRRSNSQLVAKIISVALNTLLSLASMNCDPRQWEERGGREKWGKENDKEDRWRSAVHCILYVCAVWQRQPRISLALLWKMSYKHHKHTYHILSILSFPIPHSPPHGKWRKHHQFYHLNTWTSYLSCLDSIYLNLIIGNYYNFFHIALLKQFKETLSHAKEAGFATV